MGSPEHPTGRPRELQGPRPAPLKVRKDSHKIKKPPLAPAPAHPAAAALLQQQQQQQRGPVIIYTVSPKVIHANPGEFMTLVQRLTGSTSSAADTDPPSAACGGGGALSPAARMATYERSGREQRKWVGGGGGGSGMEGMDYQWDVGGGGGGGSGMEGMNYQWDVGCGGQAVGQCFPGILSPAPSSLPPVSPNLFSPSSFDLSFLQDLMMSPAAAAAVFPASGGGNRFGDGGGFLASPGNFLSTPILPSPGTLRDLFNQLDGP